MITSIKIQGFRGFKDFTANGLGRINLLVGKNNSGKTAFLEAVEFLAGDVDPATRLLRALSRRDESVWEESGDRPNNREGYEVTHLFNGHHIEIGSAFRVEGVMEQGVISATCRIVQMSPQQLLLMYPEDVSAEGLPGSLGVRVEPIATGAPEVVPLSSRGVLDTRLARLLATGYSPGFTPRAVTFIAPSSLASGRVATYWKNVALTPEEPFVIEALRIAEPGVEQLAYVGPSSPVRLGARGGMAVKIRGQEQRIPIGSLGDGAWRLLSLALAVVRSRDGFLLVDEIDTGLHHTTMADMWKMILGAAERLNVQVFATTHSYDCVSSLAPMCEPGRENTIVLQRIDTKKPVAVAYSENEIRVATERNIEVR